MVVFLNLTESTAFLYSVDVFFKPVVILETIFLVELGVNSYSTNPSSCFSSIVGMKHLLGCFPSVVWHLSGASHFHFLSQKINFDWGVDVKIDRLTVSYLPSERT